jgi:hypothetical protein
MWEDPIVAEVHHTRRELAKKFGFDVHAIVADIRERQVSLGSRLVSPAERVAPPDRGGVNGSSASVSPQSPRQVS